MEERVYASTERYKKEMVHENIEHVSLGGGLRGSVLTTGLVLSIIACVLLGFLFPALIIVFVILEVIFIGLLARLVAGIRVAAQWEKVVIFRLGKYHKVKEAGVLYVLPVFDYPKFVDMRISALDIPHQSVITMDNVPIEVDGVLFFQVEDANKAITNIQDYRFAVAQYAQNSLRDVVGSLSLDEVLSERERIQTEICQHIQEKVKAWGLNVDSVRLQDIKMPEDLKRMMSRQASAEREKRATIIKAEGDKLASINLAEAAQIMKKNPGAMQLRTLQSIDGLGSSSANTVLVFPVEIFDALKDFKEALVPTKQDENN